MLEETVAELATLVGTAALISFIVNVLKAVGIVKNDTSKLWVGALNVVALVALFIFRVINPDLSIGEFDLVLGRTAAAGEVLLSYILMIISSKATHTAVRGLPIIGTSFTEKEKLML